MQLEIRAVAVVTCAHRSVSLVSTDCLALVGGSDQQLACQRAALGEA
jgi:hypothetical protein